MNTIQALISSVDLLFHVFVPGALCVWCYRWLDMKKMSDQMFFVLSVAIGYLIKSSVDYLDTTFWSIAIKDFPLVLAYVLFGLLYAVVFFKLKNWLPVRKLFSNVLGVETAGNIFTQHFDDAEGVLVKVFMKDGNIFYGKPQGIDDDYISLVHYYVSKDDSLESWKSAADTLKTNAALCIPMPNVNRFEFIYPNAKSDAAKFILQNGIE